MTSARIPHSAEQTCKKNACNVTSARKPHSAEQTREKTACWDLLCTCLHCTRRMNAKLACKSCAKDLQDTWQKTPETAVERFLFTKISKARGRVQQSKAISLQREKTVSGVYTKPTKFRRSIWASNSMWMHKFALIRNVLGDKRALLLGHSIRLALAIRGFHGLAIEVEILKLAQSRRCRWESTSILQEICNNWQLRTIECVVTCTQAHSPRYCCSGQYSRFGLWQNCSFFFFLDFEWHPLEKTMMRALQRLEEPQHALN